MKTAFILMCVGWVISVGILIYTIINEKTRENGSYLYSFIAMNCFALAVQLINIFI